MSTKIKAYTLDWIDHSSRKQLSIEPVDYDKDSEAVVDGVLQILEKDLGGKRIKVIEGLEQTFIDYDINGVFLSFELNPWFFLNLLTPSDELREDVRKRLSNIFDIRPMPKNGKIS